MFIWSEAWRGSVIALADFNLNVVTKFCTAGPVWNQHFQAAAVKFGFQSIDSELHNSRLHHYLSHSGFACMQSLAGVQAHVDAKGKNGFMHAPVPTSNEGLELELSRRTDAACWLV